MQQLTLSLSPTTTFTLPESDGYTLYGALLNLIQDAAPDKSDYIHNTNHAVIHNTGLTGDFGDPGDPHRKTAYYDNTYTLRLGLFDDHANDLYDTIAKTLLLNTPTLSLPQGDLKIEEITTKQTTHEKLLEKATNRDPHRLEFTFETPVCIQEAGSVTTMVPHRTAIFPSLLTRWNKTCPEKYELDLREDTIAAHLIEKPHGYHLKSANTVVNRFEPTNQAGGNPETKEAVPDGGETEVKLRQGFTGEFAYQFKNASDATRTAVTTLALFAEYAGIGRAVARGCGATTVQLR
ncbi:CRISPR system precrRNA processing endoribonuclease RAMP protein Cas6 [Salinibaculum rarum]|uniref:CRISPR system precrRNA processing endoribonuclease RAMP protein Cas6 n=1 Tax=Salinibaculum rarum TaxID=3058903 RepID=UPI00265E1832|nr:CRISPR system precrRNA processing endoribonuclease RAMP protein Cas6 [Salinibaculum sp. KK48]